MKKILSVVLLLCLGLSLCGCSGSGEKSTPTSSPAPTQEPIDEELCNRFYDLMPYYAYPEFKRNDSGIVSIKMKVDSEDISHYGDIIYTALCAADDIFGEYTMRINFWNGSTIPITFSGNSSSATIGDSRSGSMKMTEIKSVEDLAQYFPALNLLLDTEKDSGT